MRLASTKSLNQILLGLKRTSEAFSPFGGISLTELAGCATARALFAVEKAALAKVDSQSFHNWQQFHDQRYQKEQADLDTASGLSNTGELSRAYFGSDSQFLCYKFTAYDRLTMPVLIMVGKYDGAVGVDQMRDLADHLAHARFDEFDQSAHFPYAEEPEKFEKDVADFLSSSTANER